MVSIRMPKSLVLEIKKLVDKHHFLDLSEMVRSIVRQRWMEYTKPELYELKKLRKDIKEEIKIKSMKKVQEEINKELKKIREQLKEEQLLK
jgi:Arc/MetJ-type ribon-helix-helix transcriptional regulator